MSYALVVEWLSNALSLAYRVPTTGTVLLGPNPVAVDQVNCAARCVASSLSNPDSQTLCNEMQYVSC